MKSTNQSLQINATAPAKRLNQYLKASQVKAQAVPSLLIRSHG